ncbi:MAG: aminotransferase class V-fold PLP-dependent enzyme [Ruminococcus sp.]|nr:aminotransferase class V-fold PLP-dependent enzyme [Ruminococcus sp.]
MIYFDNGATTFPKPKTVVNAVNRAMLTGANPGRSGHQMSVRAGELLYQCRVDAARLFDFDKPENVVFTLNCTTALNTVIQGLLRGGGHAVISSLEHNAVLRPLEALRSRGVTYSVAGVEEGDSEQTVNNFRRALQPDTKLVVCTHASNVFGIRLPVERIAALCRIYHIPFCLDAAQSAGVFPISMRDSCIDYLCTAGHKGLYGPMGTGLLLVNSERLPHSLIQGGTGSLSAQRKMPDMLPDRYESGTPNLSGIAGLDAGIQFVSRQGIQGILRHEIRLAQRLYDMLSVCDGVQLYTARPEADTHAPVVSFNVGNYDSEEVASVLNDRYGIAVRAGLHCAPLAHEYFGTQYRGTVRAVMSIFNNNAQVERLCEALNKISKKA